MGSPTAKDMSDLDAKLEAIRARAAAAAAEIQQSQAHAQGPPRVPEIYCTDTADDSESLSPSRPHAGHEYGHITMREVGRYAVVITENNTAHPEPLQADFVGFGGDIPGEVGDRGEAVAERNLEAPRLEGDVVAETRGPLAADRSPAGNNIRFSTFAGVQQERGTNFFDQFESHWSGSESGTGTAEKVRTAFSRLLGKAKKSGNAPGKPRTRDKISRIFAGTRSNKGNA